MFLYKRTMLLLFLLFCVGSLFLFPRQGVCNEGRTDADAVSPPPFAPWLDAAVAQVVWVTGDSDNKQRGKLSAWEKTDGVWTCVSPPTPVSLGVNGLIAPTNKREGDGCTPTGVYDLKRAFGYQPFPAKLSYRQLTDSDCWVDEPLSPDYNQFVDRIPASGSYEVMKRRDGLYKLGIVMEYNTEPVVPGKGSAIFLHIWRGPGRPTAGCVAMAEETITKLLGWLDIAKQPVIVIDQAE